MGDKRFKPNDTIKKAYKIAVKSLKSCYMSDGIYAGLTHFSDYWARDSFFSCIGALEIGDKKKVKQNLEFFLRYTREDGQVPLRIGNYNMVEKYLRYFFGLKGRKEMKPRYMNDMNRHFPIDVNSLLLVASHYYIKRAKDYSFGRSHFPMFVKILQRSFKNDKNYNLLIEDQPNSSWADSLKIKGESIYVNVCHCAAVRAMAEIAKLIKHEDQDLYQKVYEELRRRINEMLWNGKFYGNYYLAKQRVNIFSTAGNLLAIHWKIADKKQARSIEREIKLRGINDYVPSLTNFPKYPYKVIFYPFYILGLYDYHNYGMCWLWLGAEDAIVKFKLGEKKEAYDLLEKMSRTIVEHNGVYEVYEKDGKPVNRPFYKSEVPFAWSSSLFIKAYHTIFEKKRKIVY